MSEFPHFIAGLMNASWGYLLISGRIDLNIIIFAIPLSLHLLNVILIFEIPDLEADINGGKKNFIVKRGRQKSFLLISIIFWITSFYFMFLAIIGWFSEIINFWLLSFISIIPSIISTFYYFKKPIQQRIATNYAIRTAISLFIISLIFLVYFIFLLI
jgi:1,4-dihydroxy-2-naphthoate octaprenyltransferase